MHDRTALGHADVADDELARMVASALGVHEVELLSSQASETDYDLPSITTAGRFWVEGKASADGCVFPDGCVLPYRLFVKHLQSFTRSPLAAGVPDEVRERLDEMVPWRREAEIYRADIAGLLPSGLAIPQALGVFDLDELSAAIWLEEVPSLPVTWSLDRYRSAAHLLGRMAGSPALAATDVMGRTAWDVRDYLAGRLSFQILPMLLSHEIWRHPLVAAAFDSALHDGLLRAADRAPALVEELSGFPKVPSHGDACPNNLLVVADRPGFTLIDFAHLCPMPLGFDLGQLLVGDVQIGKRPADDLAERDEACLAAYVEGLRAEGMAAEASDVRRAHALQLMIFTGLSTLPFEYLDAGPTPELTELVAGRAEIARYSMALLAATD
jgi:hypothetical protein